jgi:hypothetical protein
MSTPQELVACVERLASLPAVYHRIRALLDDPDSSVQELAECRLQRCWHHRPRAAGGQQRAVWLSGKIETVARAVNLMGMQQVHDLVLSTSVIGAFSGIRPARMHMIRFWKDCVFRGLAAGQPPAQLGTGDPERMFVEGLLADIGHLVMFQATARGRRRSPDRVTPQSGPHSPDRGRHRRLQFRRSGCSAGHGLAPALRLRHRHRRPAQPGDGGPPRHRGRPSQRGQPDPRHRGRCRHPTPMKPPSR